LSSGKRRNPWLLTISIVGTILLSTHIVAWLVCRPLEIWYPHDPVPANSAEAIVILSGTVHHPTPNRPYTVPAQDTYERLQHGIWLFNHWKRLPILVCGGALDKYEPYSVAMRRVLESEGIPPDSIWVENRSRSTHENAVYGADILHEHGVTRIVLVVEANSMPRAAAAFRKAGVTVIPAAIRFTELHRDLNDVLPNWQAIALNGEALHEYVGIVWYRLRGWI
jgi:uncharacterized SAM-binding protein YcdF (DUF218 family)